jgi:hypothetical protein
MRLVKDKVVIVADAKKVEIFYTTTLIMTTTFSTS